MLTDVEIIDKYANNEISGITICDNFFFLPVRISGIGKTFRIDEDNSKSNVLQALDSMGFKIDSIKEKNFAELADYFNKNAKGDLKDFIKFNVVDRKLEHFANPKSLEALQGLPILKEHPTNNGEASLLGYENISDNKIIGTIVKPYVFNGAIWGLAKIFDLELLDQLKDLKSTSPAVESVQIEKNGIYEELPLSFNHLAFVEKGHWDSIDGLPYDSGEVNLNLEREVKEAMEKEKEKKVDEAVGEGTTESIESVAKDVAAIKEAEKNEAENYEKMAESHENLDECEKESKIDNETESETETETDDEVIDDDSETEGDKKRVSIIDSMRKVIDSSNPQLMLKMPFLNKRYKPSVVIKKILDCNSKFVSEKYANIDSKSHFELLKDAYDDMVKNINAKNESLYKSTEGKKKKGQWIQGEAQNVFIDKEF